MKENNVNSCKVFSVYAPSRMSKEDKIKGYSDNIKDNFEFIAPNCMKPAEIPVGYIYFERDADYERAMDDMEMYTSVGKNYNDDAPDSMSQLAIRYEKRANGEVTATHNPFRGV